MRLRNLLSSICAASIVALSFVGCSDYDNGYTEQQISFIKNFKEIYGEVDPTQDWNLAERAYVTVNVSQPSEIKIYAKTDGKYKLVGDYEDVTGVQTLGFDVVEGTQDIMVSDGQTAQYSTVGGSVMFGSTRHIYPTTSITEKVDDYLIIDQETYSTWRHYIPEGVFNIGKVSEDFLYVSTGDFVIYPIYWNTTNVNTLGIYYNDGTGTKYVDIYDIRSDQSKGQDITEIRTSNDGKNWDNANGFGTPYTLEWNGIELAENQEYPKNPPYIQAKGIKVKLKPGTVFGMYLRAEGNNRTDIFYSDKERNTDPGVRYWTDENGEFKKEKDWSIKATHAATFIDQGNMYIGFEDWENEITNSDFDLNDCLFMFGEDIPEIVDDEANRWILSAEDLGNTLDLDYNDVVIEVQYTSGRNTAYVTPYAAGGTLASFVYFGDVAVGSTTKGSDGNYKTGEIHELFSSVHAQEKSGYYTPINVKSTGMQTYSKRTYPVNVGTNFSLASNVVGEVGTADDKSIGEMEKMGGFNIRVIPYGDPVDPEVAKTMPKRQRIQNGDIGETNAPFVICTPKYWVREDNHTRGHFRWPQESVPMLPMGDGSPAPAYHNEGHTFKAWVADKNDEFGKDWYKYPTPEITCAPSEIGPNPEEGIKLQDPNLRINEEYITQLGGTIGSNGYIYLPENTVINIFKSIFTDSDGDITFNVVGQGTVFTKLDSENDGYTEDGDCLAKSKGLAVVGITQALSISHKANTVDYSEASIQLTIYVYADGETPWIEDEEPEDKGQLVELTYENEISMIQGSYFNGANKMSDITIYLEAIEDAPITTTLKDSWNNNGMYKIFFNAGNPNGGYNIPTSISLSGGDLIVDSTTRSYTIKFTDDNNCIEKLKEAGLCIMYLENCNVYVKIGN